MQELSIEFSRWFMIKMSRKKSQFSYFKYQNVLPFEEEFLFNWIIQIKKENYLKKYYVHLIKLETFWCKINLKSSIARIEFHLAICGFENVVSTDFHPLNLFPQIYCIFVPFAFEKMPPKKTPLSPEPSASAWTRTVPIKPWFKWSSRNWHA